jgi:hypothetical protein
MTKLSDRTKERPTQECQLWQHLPIDFVVAKCRCIALKTQTLQPRLYVHAIILGSEERQLHLFKDIAVPVDLPAADYDYPGGTVLYGRHGHDFGHMGIGAEGTIAHHGMGFGRSISAAHFGVTVSPTAA